MFARSFAKKLCIGLVAITALGATAQPASATAPQEQIIVAFAPGTDPEVGADRLAAAGFRVDHVLRNVFPGAIATGPKRSSYSIPGAQTIEPDRAISASSTDSDPGWSLDRIDQKSLPLSDSYRYNTTGFGVDIYVIDSGVRSHHRQFGRRVKRGFSVVRDGRGTEDCSGHGTHVAGTAVGSDYGVARRASIVPVRILDCRGNGTIAGAVRALDWVIGHHRAGKPAVANFSIGIYLSPALDRAVRAVSADRIPAIVAAGNEADDACNYSPARTAQAITVGATDQLDRRADFSNFGPCVDIFAPGTRILSAWKASNTASRRFSGTSMATPHVTGAAALILQRHPRYSTVQVRSALMRSATAGVVTDSRGAHSRLLFTAQGRENPPPANDAFANATVMTPVTGSQTYTSNTTLATAERNEPDHPAADAKHTVWWEFTAPNDGLLELSTEGTRFDTVMSVHVGPTVSTLSEAANNDDVEGALWSQVAVGVTHGTTYRIVVDGFSGARGPVQLTAKWAGIEPNDNFAAATPIVADGLVKWLTVSTMFATRETGEPEHVGREGSGTLWWRLTVPTTRTVTISTVGSDFDTMLAVYQGGSLAALTEVTSNDDAVFGEVWSEVSFVASPGVTYRLVLDGYGGSSGSAVVWID